MGLPPARAVPGQAKGGTDVGKQTIAQRLSAFTAKYTGKLAVGDTPGNRGECVGLVEVWTDALGLPHTWGNAKDLLENADPAKFKVIRNTPTNKPGPGDVIVWGGDWGDGYGHTAIVLSAGVMAFTAFEQNDPYGSPPHRKLYGYQGVIGWLHPLVKL